MKITTALLFILVGLSLVASFEKASDEQIFKHFQSFMSTHNKNYSTIEEFKNRFEIFKLNYKKVDVQQQMLQKRNDATYEIGVTQFFDLTPQEFAKTHLTLDISSLQKLKAQASPLAATFADPAPASWDWREQNKVSKVKSQGSCGS